MVQVDNKNVENRVYFPKNSDISDKNLILGLHSELTQNTYEIEVEDISTKKKFYIFNVDFSDIDAGEYDYSIGLSGDVKDTGLIRIGSIEYYTPDVVSYYNEYQITQYGDDKSSQFKLQVKEVEYDENGEHSITADEGYYGLKRVDVGINIPVDDYYDSGYTDGIAEQKSKLIGLDISSNGTVTRPDGWSAVTVNVPTGSTIYNQNKELNIINNGSTSVTFDSGYTGLGNVYINTNVPTGHTDAEIVAAYNSGITHQKSLLVSTAITENGVYSRDNGYSSINVNVPTGSTIINQNKNLNFSQNVETSVTFDNGYTGLGTVNIKVNVPQTGYTQEDLDNSYNSGYTRGYSLGWASGMSVGYDKGYVSGSTDGYNLGYNDGFNNGKEAGYNSGYTSGYNTGFASGETVGYESGVVDGIESGKTIGYNSGYTVGYGVGYDAGFASGYSSAIKYFSISVYFQDAPSALLNNAGFKVSYLDSEDDYTYTGSAITARITPGTTYTISFYNVEGYLKPNDISGLSSWDGSASYYITYEEEQHYDNMPLTLEIVSGGTLRLFAGENGFTRDVQYKVNTSSWTNGTFSYTNYTELNVSAGDKVEFRGNNYAYAENLQNKNCMFTGTAKFNAYGNIMSLVNSTSFSGITSVDAFAFVKLFYASKILDATYLYMPATSLSSDCYAYMFGNSTITSAPALPATTLANECYGYMFYGCSGLTTAPSLTHITTQGDSAMAYMFQSSGLQTIELPSAAFSQSCYYYMFKGCTSLTYIKCLVDATDFYVTFHWLENASSTGTFVKKSGVEWTRDISGIPSGWTVIEE